MWQKPINSIFCSDISGFIVIYIRVCFNRSRSGTACHCQLSFGAHFVEQIYFPMVEKQSKLLLLLSIIHKEHVYLVIKQCNHQNHTRVPVHWWGDGVSSVTAREQLDIILLWYTYPKWIWNTCVLRYCIWIQYVGTYKSYT